MSAIMRLTTGVVYVRSISGTLTTTGPILNGDGSGAAPTYSFTSDSNTGIFSSGAGQLAVSIDGNQHATFTSTGMYGSVNILSSGAINFADGGAGSALGFTLVRDAANILAQKNGTNAQEFRVYGTTTGTKYVRLYSDGATSILQALGANNDLALYSAGPNGLSLGGDVANHWRITNAGHLVTPTDNTYDIGASGATRPRSGYFGTSVSSPQLTAPSGQNLDFGANAVASLWRISTSGHLLAVADNTYDIGSATDTRPRTIYAGTGINVNNGTATLNSVGALGLVHASGTINFGNPADVSLSRGAANRLTLATGDAMNLAPTAFASLPTGAEGDMACITDSNTATWGATIAGGGANNVIGFFNGTNWTVMGA